MIYRIFALVLVVTSFNLSAAQSDLLNKARSLKNSVRQTPFELSAKFDPQISVRQDYEKAWPDRADWTVDRQQRFEISIARDSAALKALWDPRTPQGRDLYGETLARLIALQWMNLKIIEGPELTKETYLAFARETPAPVDLATLRIKPSDDNPEFQILSSAISKELADPVENASAKFLASFLRTQPTSGEVEEMRTLFKFSRLHVATLMVSHVIAKGAAAVAGVCAKFL